LFGGEIFHGKFQNRSGFFVCEGEEPSPLPSP
jgi:hypothetical protein